MDKCVHSMIYFHSERGAYCSQSHSLALHSANLIDFFIEAFKMSEKSLIVLPCTNKSTSVLLGLGANTEVMVIPFPTHRAISQILAIFGFFRSLFSRRLIERVRQADCTASCGLESFGMISGLLCAALGRHRHRFIVRGDRFATVRSSTRSRASKNFLLLRLHIYRFIMDTLLRLDLAEVWFQGNLNRDAFVARLGEQYKPQLKVLNAVLREMPDADEKPEEKKYDLVFVGHLHREKGVFELAEAVAELREQGLALSVLMIGVGVDEVVLRKKIDELGLGGHFDFAGYVPNVKELVRNLRLARMFVLPSHTEGMPRAMVEAMALGLPVLVSKVGGIPYVIKDGVNGWLVEPKSPGALAMGIKKAMEANYSGSYKEMVIRAQQDALAMSFSRRAEYFFHD